MTRPNTTAEELKKIVSKAYREGLRPHQVMGMKSVNTPLSRIVSAFYRAAKHRLDTDLVFRLYVESMISDGKTSEHIMDVTGLRYTDIITVRRRLNRAKVKCECCGELVKREETTAYKGREVWPEGFYDAYKKDSGGDLSKLPMKRVCRFCLFGGKEAYEKMSEESSLLFLGRKEGTYGQGLHGTIKVRIEGV